MAVRERVETILKRVAEVEGINNCEITANTNALSGDGFLSEFYTGAILCKETGSTVKVYIKVKPPKELVTVEPSFFNELNFYSKIYPELDRFQRQQGVKELFDKIPKFFCGSLDPHQEYLAFADLVADNYVLFDKTKFIDEEHLKIVFEAYGKFHALAFAFKAHNPEKYHELIKPVRDIFGLFLPMESFQKNVKANFQLALEYVKENSKQNVNKIQLLIDDFDSTSSRGFYYEGDYSAWTHGDCWSNNILFRYLENGDLETVKIIDHQAGRDSTPVHDLSYFFYSGASRTYFDKLDDYLDLYYKSFSKFAQELGFNPDKLLPLEALKSDWKKYGFFGIYMAIVIWEFKLVSKKDIQDETADSHDDKDGIESFIELGKKGRANPLYQKNIGDLLIHAAEYGIV